MASLQKQQPLHPRLAHASATPRRRTAARWAAYAALAGATLLVHGYHPFAEDGGLYAAGVEYLLDPRLFPHDSAFVTGHLRFSVFAPCMAALVRHTFLSLQTALLLVYLVSTALTFAGADRLLRGLDANLPSRRGALLLLCAWWTLPVAGTSLFLQDPYLTARSAAFAASLWALAIAADVGPTAEDRRTRRLLGAACCWLLAFVSHPLMAGYAFALFACLRAVRSAFPVRAALACTAAALLLAGVVQWHGQPETAAVVAASLSRYYWFLSRWRWFEVLGLAGPVLVLLALLRWPQHRLSGPARDLAHACLLLAGIAVAVSVAYAHASFQSHAVARLQPLRAFVMIYAIMIPLLGASAASWWQRLRASRTNAASERRVGAKAAAVIPPLAALLLASIMYRVERAQFSSSAHLELPGRFEQSPNPWVQAFLWIQANTPQDALFALDAHYISAEDEDAQTFRSIARRSVLPDYSKDGGEASITPDLAPLWFQGQRVQTGLATLGEAERKARLRPLGVAWVVLPRQTPSAPPCPYRNGAVEVCPL